MSRFPHIISVFVSLVVATVSARADAVAQREDQFKAAYLFNFVKFVEWPAAAVTDTLTICFAGGEGVYQALAAGIENKRVGTRRLAALRITDMAPLDICNVVYMDSSLTPAFMPTVQPAVLTISDAADFAANGGMIGLFTQNHRLRFAVNVQSVQLAGLRISSDLLKLAASVQRGSP